jgi:hypothetical protein
MKKSSYLPALALDERRADPNWEKNHAETKTIACRLRDSNGQNRRSRRETQESLTD